MTNEKKIFFEQFENWILTDIRIILDIEKDGVRHKPDRSIKDYHRPFVAAVILSCCAIDCLAAFWSGRKNNKVGETFKGFLREYFTSDNTASGKSYQENEIYNGLRNALLHGYSLSHDLALSHTDESLHMQIINGHPIIDVYMLYYDLEKIYFKFKDDLSSGMNEENFKKRWDYAPLISYRSEENLKR